MPTQQADTALEHLVAVMAGGLTPDAPNPADALAALFGDRYPVRYQQQAAVRDAYRGGADHVAFAGLLPDGSPPSGAYGGMSLVWFPRSRDAGGGSLLTLVVGTLGLHPDEAILGRPGHQRHVAALRRHLARRGVPAWGKPDPAAIDTPLPRAVRDAFPGWDGVFGRYERVIYALAEVGPGSADQQRETVAAFLDLYARERGWPALAAYRTTVEGYLASLDAEIFRSPTEAEIGKLLLERRFVVLQGPPGTGKTRAADRIRQAAPFSGHGLVVQFHPAITYEDFIIGLAPQPAEAGLHFDVRPGWLLAAVAEAEARPGQPFLLHIDEINRGDLAKVLGEAIYLFEPGEPDRAVTLPHPWRGSTDLRLPANLCVLATMNTADRSIASLDLAIRRRFAFSTIWPDRQAVARTGLPLALDAFDRLAAVFVEHASPETFALLPGHAYYLAGSEAELCRRLRHELLPLLDEYLTGGLLGGAAPEIQATRDWIADRVEP